MATKLKTGEKFLFIGDSITDCGCRDDRWRPLGNGYVRLFGDLVTIREPQKQITVVNRGIGGNTADDLRNRWHDDVVSHAPDWLSIKIGINDSHRFLNGTAPHLYGPEGFAGIFDDILAITKKQLPACRILLIDPFYLSGEKNKDAFRAKVVKLLPQYIDTVDTLSRKYGTLHVKTNELFHKQLKYHHPDVFCCEPVHPNQTGHLLIAEAVYAAIS